MHGIDAWAVEEQLLIEDVLLWSESRLRDGG